MLKSVQLESAQLKNQLDIIIRCSKDYWPTLSHRILIIVNLLRAWSRAVMKFFVVTILFNRGQ